VCMCSSHLPFTLTIRPLDFGAPLPPHTHTLSLFTTSTRSNISCPSHFFLSPTQNPQADPPPPQTLLSRHEDLQKNCFDHILGSMALLYGILNSWVNNFPGFVRYVVIKVENDTPPSNPHFTPPTPNLIFCIFIFKFNSINSAVRTSQEILTVYHSWVFQTFWDCVA